MSTPNSTPSEAAAPPVHRPTWREIPALDGLRGVAVLGVLLFHDGRLPGGFLGVDLFFALSGFLITALLLHEREAHGSISLAAFWARRARRLLPAMLAFLVVILPLMRLWGSPSQVDDARSGIVPSLLYVVNWHQIAQESDYWALFTDPSPMTHLWSLAVEEQFYLLWPIVVAVVASRRYWRRWLAVVTVGGIAASAAVMAALYDPASPTRVYIGTDSRAASLLLGALAAVAAGAVRRHQRRTRWMEHRAALPAVQAALVGAIAVIWAYADGQTSDWLFRGGLLAHGLLSAALVATLGAATSSPVQWVLSRRPLRWLGTISYGLYLWHWPVFILLSDRRTGIDGLPLSVLRWSASIAIAVLSFLVVEQPIRRDHRRWTAARVRVGVAAATGAAVLMVIVVPSPDTAPAAFDPGSIATTTSTTQAPASTTSSGSGEPAAPTTAPPPLPALGRVLLQGDSVAFDAAPGVLAALTAAGVDASETTALGLGLVATPAGNPVELFGQHIADRRPDLVILMLSTWDAQYEIDAQRTAVDAYADMVIASGARLAFLTPPPIDPSLDIGDVSVVLARATELAELYPDRILLLDATPLWGEFLRDINGDGVPERKPDGIHVCPQGAAMLGNWLAATLAQRFRGISPAPPAEWAGGSWTQEPRYSDPLGACA